MFKKVDHEKMTSKLQKTEGKYHTGNPEIFNFIVSSDAAAFGVGGKGFSPPFIGVYCNIGSCHKMCIRTNRESFLKDYNLKNGSQQSPLGIAFFYDRSEKEKILIPDAGLIIKPQKEKEPEEYSQSPTDESPNQTLFSIIMTKVSYSLLHYTTIFDQIVFETFNNSNLTARNLYQNVALDFLLSKDPEINDFLKV